MSRNLLSKRLRQLVDEGVADRDEEDGTPRYHLTAAGHELVPVIEALGEWGVRWIDSLTEDDLDPAFLMWDVERSIDRAALPEGTTVLEVRFTDLDPEARQWWLLLRPDEVEICQDVHGFEVDVTITSEIRPFVRLWRGEMGWDDVLRGGAMTLEGPSHLRRQVPDWLELSRFASVEKPSQRATMPPE